MKHRLFPQVVSETRQDRARAFLTRMINARYSIPTWLWASSSLIVGGIIIMITITDPKAAQPFISHVALGAAWAPLVLVFSLVGMIGMALKHERTVRIGSFVCFCLWVFGAVAFVGSGGGIVVFYYVGQLVVFWAYKYLASFVRYDHRL